MGMNPNELAALPDALWEKYADAERQVLFMNKDEFHAAIKEAMQAQRKRDAEICRRKTGRTGFAAIHEELGAASCAAAIEREPLGS